MSHNIKGQCAKCSHCHLCYIRDPHYETQNCPHFDPEIIYCKDCENSSPDHSWCKLLEIKIKPNDFCSFTPEK